MYIQVRNLVFNQVHCINCTTPVKISDASPLSNLIKLKPFWGQRLVNELEPQKAD